MSLLLKCCGSQYADPYYQNVSLLLNGDGTNGSQTIVDSSLSAQAITANGNAQISTAQKKYGTGAIYFDGAGDYLTIPSNSVLNFGTSDFTVEVWVYLVSTASVQFIIRDTTSGMFGLITNGGKFELSASGVADDIIGTTSYSANTWYHVAVIRLSGVFKLYVNGVQDGTSSVSRNYGANTTIVIGGSSGGFYLNGYIDDLRITKSVARYTANFTPPTSALTL